MPRRWSRWELLAALSSPTRLVQTLAGGVEWSERWGAWPHCNGQARCWMHLAEPDRWCECSCRWCRLARRVRAGQPTGPPGRYRART